MSTTLSVVGASVCFLLMFVSGYWLSHSGRPYNVVVLTIHKLISLAAGVFIVTIGVQSHRVAAVSAVEMAAGLVTALLFVSLIATGGLLSSKRPMPTLVSKLHHIAPYLALATAAATLYLMLGRRQ